MIMAIVPPRYSIKEGRDYWIVIDGYGDQHGNFELFIFNKKSEAERFMWLIQKAMRTITKTP
jgi:hypothetical protein